MPLLLADQMVRLGHRNGHTSYLANKRQMTEVWVFWEVNALGDFQTLYVAEIWER